MRPVVSLLLAGAILVDLALAQGGWPGPRQEQAEENAARPVESPPRASGPQAPAPRAVEPARPDSAHMEPVVETYTVNAQYRGGVKKGFRDIGRGKAVFQPGGPTRFAVKLEGTVENPDNRDTYQFWLDMEFQISGSSIRLLRNGSRYNERAQEYRERVEKVVPFVYLAKYVATPGPGQDPSRSFRYSGSEFAMRYVPTERHVEASLYEGDALVGKFFLLRDQQRSPLVFEKFRVPTDGNVVLSFIRN